MGCGCGVVSMAHGATLRRPVVATGWCRRSFRRFMRELGASLRSDDPGGGLVRGLAGLDAFARHLPHRLVFRLGQQDPLVRMDGRRSCDRPATGRAGGEAVAFGGHVGTVGRRSVDTPAAPCADIVGRCRRRRPPPCRSRPHHRPTRSYHGRDLRDRRRKPRRCPPPPIPTHCWPTWNTRYGMPSPTTNAARRQPSWPGCVRYGSASTSSWPPGSTHRNAPGSTPPPCTCPGSSPSSPCDLHALRVAHAYAAEAFDLARAAPPRNRCRSTGRRRNPTTSTTGTARTARSAR